MMTMTLRAALILVSVATLFLMMRKIRQSKLQIESAVFWIVLALVLVVFSLFPQAADLAAHCLGIYSTANFLFLFAIFVLIVKVFYMSLHISQLETKIKELVQQMALEEKKNQEEKAAMQRMLQEARGVGKRPEAYEEGAEDRGKRLEAYEADAEDAGKHPEANGADAEDAEKRPEAHEADAEDVGTGIGGADEG